MSKVLDYDGTRVMDTYEQEKNKLQLDTAMATFTPVVWVGTPNNVDLLTNNGVTGTAYTLGTWSTSDTVDGANLVVKYDPHTIYMAPNYAKRGTQVVFDVRPSES